MERRPIHAQANTVLCREVLPVMKNEEVGNSIKNDELLLSFGTELCEKYTHARHHRMIRARLGLLGRFKCAVKNIIDEEIDDFASIIHPKFCDAAVLAMRKCSKYNTVTKEIDSPTTAAALGTALKQCTTHDKNQCLREDDYERATAADDFLAFFVKNYEFLTAPNIQE